FHQGGGSARGEYGFLVSRLVEAGYDVVAADLQGGGDRFGFPNRTLAEAPEGADFSYCDAAPQLTMVLDSVVSWYPDARRIGWGSSYSGALLLHAAAEGADVDQVLAFSPAAGGPMGECSANHVADRIEVPTLVVRPAGEAEIGSVREQLALFGGAGHQVLVASPGMHGSSMLNPVRVGSDVDATWALIESFLQRPARRTGSDSVEGSDAEAWSEELAAPIWADGDFQDWDDVTPMAIDAWGDVSPGSAADLRSVRARVDERFVHLLVDVGHTITLQGFRGSFEIVIDADGDPETGATEESHLGAEAALVYSQPGDLASGVGFGVGIHRVEGDGLGSVEPAGRAGVLAAPTHSSDRFEIRIERGMVLGDGASLEADTGFAAVTLRLLGPEGPLDQLGPFVVPLVPAAIEPDLLGQEALDRGPDQLRVVAWNVSSGQFHRREAAFQRVLAALSADVVLLDEVPADATADGLDAFFSGVEEAEWQWWLAEGGGVQRTLVASSTHAVQGEPSLAKIDYPPGALEGWISETDSAEFALSRAALEAGGGLSATGAWIDVDSTPVLFVPLDFQSAGYDGSPQDRLRELQAGVLREAVAQVLARRPGAGLVFGGDLNLVGSGRPLEALIAGLGPLGEDLRVAEPLNPLDRSLATWRSLGNADDFSPGRLDFVAFRSGPLEVVRAFVFDAEHYAPEVLESMGLRGSETAETSDHLPVVVDFRTGR
ncbi:MAG: hypothetical protein HKN73_04140, partial [Gemmatimonadetes bacterium]|nr:hypothetical protein [Gemmatimonadota bacterium]